jgi:hypothetical protein
MRALRLIKSRNMAYGQPLYAARGRITLLKRPLYGDECHPVRLSLERSQ